MFDLFYGLVFLTVSYTIYELSDNLTALGNPTLVFLYWSVRVCVFFLIEHCPLIRFMYWKYSLPFCSPP